MKKRIDEAFLRRCKSEGRRMARWFEAIELFYLGAPEFIMRLDFRDMWE